jgi:chitin disaccharide deacetylase
MKRLIVNADDLGADEARNDGIFAAIEAGTVTSTSILSNSPALEDAVCRIRALNQKNVSFGIHVNLSEGKPLSSDLRHLTGPDGSFLGKSAAQRLLLCRGDLELEKEIRKEIDAQITMLQSAGIPIDHLDGHQHVHVFPAVIRLATEAAKTYGIKWMRIPEEHPDDYLADSPSPAVCEEARSFSSYAQAARPLLAERGISATSHFRGLYLKGNLPASRWMEFLGAIPRGLTELMVHPGHAAGSAIPGPFSGFSTADREKELDALIDGRFRTALLKTGVELIPFPRAQDWIR